MTSKPHISRLDIIKSRLDMKGVDTPSGEAWYSAYLLDDVKYLVEQLEALKRLETFARNEVETGKSAHIRNWCSFALAAAGLNDSNPASEPKEDA